MLPLPASPRRSKTLPALQIRFLTLPVRRLVSMDGIDGTLVESVGTVHYEELCNGATDGSRV